MDKETLSSYGWIVVLVLVLSVLLALATPFGDFISTAVKSTTQGLFNVQQKAMGIAGLEVMQQEFEDMFNGGESGETPPTESPKDVLPVFNQPYRTVVTEDGLELMYEFVFYADGSASMWVEYLNGEYAGMAVGEFAPTGTYKYQRNTIIDTTVEGGTPLTISADAKTLSDGEMTMQLTPITTGSLQQNVEYSGNFAILGFSASMTFNADKSISIKENNVPAEPIPADMVQYYDNYIFIKGETTEDDMYCPIYPDGTKVAFGMFVMKIQGPKAPCPLYFDIPYVADNNADDTVTFYENGSFELQGNNYPAGSLFYDETKVYFQGQLLGTVSEDGLQFTGSNLLDGKIYTTEKPSPIKFEMPYSLLDGGYCISFVFHKDGSLDLYNNGKVNVSAPVGSAIYKTDVIEFAEELGLGEQPAALSEDGTQFTLMIYERELIFELGLPLTPETPVADIITHNSITLKTIAGCEYSMDGENWQESPTFTGLTPGTEYTFYARYSTETIENIGNMFVCESSGPVKISTGAQKEPPSAPSAPTLSKQTYYSITLETIYGAEYSMDGENWQTSTTFSGLDAGTEYTFYARYKATNDIPASLSSSAQFSTVSLPLASATFITQNSITLQHRGDCEYSLDGKIWQDKPSFSDLNIGTEYTFYVRIKATSDSPASSASITTISTKDYYNFVVYYGTKDQIGYTGEENETLIIPSTFCKGDVWYKVVEIADGAFRDCTTIKSISIPDSVTSIGREAFYSCDNLTTITFGENSKITNIGVQAFAECSSLESIVIPEGVTTIASGTFQSCTQLTGIIIPKSVTDINYNAFDYCASLHFINVDEENSNYCSEDGVLYTKDMKTLIRYPARKTDGTYTIPNSVNNIFRLAFYGCTNLTNIIIPNSITSIDYNYFSYCTSLTSITISNSVTSISIWAFYNCTNLTDITYCGSTSDWNTIILDDQWNYLCPEITVTCTDGTITIPRSY